MNEKRWLTVGEAAQELATTGTKILMLLKARTLEGELVDGDWRICGDSVKEVKEAGVEIQAPSCRTTCGATTCGCSR